MNKFSSFLKLQLLSASLLAIAVVPAHAGSKSVTYPVSLGNTQIGGKATYAYTAQSGSTLASIATTASGTGSILGTTSNLAALSVTNSLSSGKPAINCSFTVGNYTVFSQTTTASVTWNKSISQTFLSASTTLPVTVGGVTYPVALNGTLAGSGSVNLAATVNTTAKSVTLAGSASDTVNGAATASLSPSTGAAASVSSNLNLGASTLDTNTTVSTTAMSGSTSLSLDALNLSFSVLIKSIKTGSTISTVNLANYVAAARTFLLLSL